MKQRQLVGWWLSAVAGLVACLVLGVQRHALTGLREKVEGLRRTTIDLEPAQEENRQRRASASMPAELEKLRRDAAEAQRLRGEIEAAKTHPVR